MSLSRVRSTRASRASVAVLAMMLLRCGPAGAQTPNEPGASATQQPNQAAAESLWHRDHLTGDWGGLRRTLEDKGVTISLDYVGEVLGNVAGGVSRGWAYEHEFLGQLDVDLAKLLAWPGATLHTAAYDYAGKGMTREYVGSLATVSSIEAVPPSVRLYTLWLGQKVLQDRLEVKAGVLAPDEEFFAKTTVGGLFVGSTFGFPDGMAVNLPAGGPIYPLSAPGVLLQGKPVPMLNLRAAVLSGDPTGHSGATFPPESIPVGTVISFSGGALIMAEAVLTPEPDQEGIATRFRLGGWYHTSHHFADQHYATNGLSLADPASTGVPRNDIGDWALYGTGEAMLYRVPGSKDQGLAVFGRVAGMPTAQNEVSLYGDGGLTYKGLLPGRPDDAAGFAFAYLGISPAAQALDFDTRRFTGNPRFPIRDHELMIEVTYQAQITPWWTLQADLQRWFHPAGNVLNANGQLRRDATVIGLRTGVSF